MHSHFHRYPAYQHHEHHGHQHRSGGGRGGARDPGRDRRLRCEGPQRAPQDLLLVRRELKLALAARWNAPVADRQRLIDILSRATAEIVSLPTLE